MSVCPNDKYGRVVEFDAGDKFDTYRVYDLQGLLIITLSVDPGTPIERAYNTINAMAPCSASSQ